VAEYKQHALDDNTRESYRQKDTLLHPMNPLQEKIFEIQIDELLRMSYNIQKAWLQSSSLYLQRFAASEMLARGSAFTVRRPPYDNTL
jgi:hypothetical protein